MSGETEPRPATTWQTTAEGRAVRAEALNAELVEVLEFYATAWRHEVKEFLSGPPFRASEGIVHRELYYYPTAALAEDCGQMARKAIAKWRDRA